MIFHWLIQTRYGSKPFTNRDTCVELWRLLKRLFPSTYSAVIMPDHAHWISAPTPLITPENRYCLTRALSFLARKWEFQFESIPHPDPIPNHKHLLRQVRYVHLNPCRDGLCQDPLEWEWSTHWDIMGLITDPWMNSKNLFQALKMKPDIQAFHRYVSSDPSVKIDGTPSPTLSDTLADIGLTDIVAAVACTHRASWNDLNRKQRLRTPIIHVARALNGASTPRLSKYLGVTPRAIQLHLKQRTNPTWIKTVAALAHDLRTLKVVRRESSRNAKILANSSMRL